MHKAWNADGWHDVYPGHYTVIGGLDGEPIRIEYYARGTLYEGGVVRDICGSFEGLSFDDSLAAGGFLADLGYEYRPTWTPQMA